MIHNNNVAFPHPQQHPGEDMPQQQKKISSAEDTEEIASFLLSLKHRSVTPEPSLSDNDSIHHQAPTSDTCQFFSHSPSHEPQACVDKTPALMMKEEEEEEQQQQQFSTSMDDNIPVEGLVNGSTLVLTKDRDLVPDALFVAMAQMRPCKLTQADRVGCYKTREIGFVGMSCMHCGGQPGFGRYYPNSVRSLAQTTTSQTILKHVGNKCRFCPPRIRDAVNELLRQQAVREGMSSGRPRYGSRKIFFQRVWARLHGGPFLEEDDQASSKAATASLASDLESEMHSRNSSPASSDDEGEDDSQSSSTSSSGGKPTKRKFGGLLPTQKNLKRSHGSTAAEDETVKQPRVLSH